MSQHHEHLDSTGTHAGAGRKNHGGAAGLPVAGSDHRRVLAMKGGQSRMDWFRIQNGLSLDPRLAVVARKSGLGRGETLAVWIALYDHASRNRPRGDLSGLRADEIAVLLDIDAGKAAAALDLFYERGMITTDNRIEEWARIQRLSTERVRACRARRAAITQGREEI